MSDDFVDPFLRSVEDIRKRHDEDAMPETATLWQDVGDLLTHFDEQASRLEALQKEAKELWEERERGLDDRDALYALRREHAELQSRLDTALGLLASIRNDAADLMREGQTDARLNRILSCATHLDPVVERHEPK